ncbi:MAG: DMT family transporter [Kiloniellales bacterium]
MASSTKATLIGGLAVLLWSLLALFTVGAGELPRFQLMAMTFAVAFLASFGFLLRGGWRALGVLRQPLGAWVLGVTGLFGYHFFYFLALAHAPAVEASLIAYLWPLLIVLFSALLPGASLKWFHLAGALLGFLGAALLVTGERLAFELAYWPGYAAAAVCALAWSGYSVMNRRYAQVPTEVVSGFCGVVALLAVLCHLAFETTVVPQGSEWLAVLGLGLGPVGFAFFFWDYGTKRGSLPLLGALSYGAPLFSTLVLVAAGLAASSLSLWLACLMIVGGAVLAAKDLLFR